MRANTYTCKITEILLSHNNIPYFDSVDNFSEWKFGSESEAMVDDGLFRFKFGYIQSWKRKKKRKKS